VATVKKTKVIRMLFCDFCGKSQAEAALLIRGRDEVHICPACVETCVEILNADYEKNKLKLESPEGGLRGDPVAQTGQEGPTRDPQSSSSDRVPPPPCSETK
jgi:hypothetical protein